MPDFPGRYVRTPDGLNLHVRVHGPSGAPRLPVVCLHGLARTGADFDRLAAALAGDPARPRQVVAPDYRGRGRSDYDPDPANYNPGVELRDLLALLDEFGIARAVFIGASRGGLLTMLLARLRPQAIAGAVLNDIGPVIEPAGLMRIKGYVGRLPPAAGLADAVLTLRRLFGAQFTALTDDDWTAFAHRSFEERGGRLVPCYDPALAQTLAGFDPARPLPPLWDQFDALSGAPLMLVRGENSDLLSPETVAEMRRRRPDLQLLEVPAQGHAPLLREDDVIARIAAFVASCE